MNERKNERMKERMNENGFCCLLRMPIVLCVLGGREYKDVVVVVVVVVVGGHAVVRLCR